MPHRLFFGILFVSLVSQGAAATFSDWIDSRDPAFGLLKKAAEEADFQGWQRERLESGRALPQASAHVLADTLRRSPQVEPSLKVALAKALPSEIEASSQDDFADLSETAALIAANDTKLKNIEETMADNNYSPSTPLGMQATFETRFDPIMVEGSAADQSMQPFDHLQSMFQGQTGLGTYNVVLDWEQDTQDQGQDTSFATQFTPWGALM